MKRRPRRGVALRNMILLTLLALVLVLVVAIAITGGGEEPAVLPSSTSVELPPSSATEESSEPGSESVPESTSDLAGESAAPSHSAGQGATDPASQSATAPAEGGTPFYEADMPLLVNLKNPIPTDYKPDVADMGNGYQYDKTATKAYNALLKKATADGISLWVVSGYRSFEKQTTNFNNKIKEYEGLGYDAKAAYAATAALIAVPGTSEHSLGLALDLNSLETSFEETKAFRWLMDNCADFGFILRYPKDKVEITGISYEPWHYRYVGANHAKIIMEKGICLEEYISGNSQ